MSVKVKICGLTRPEDIRYVNQYKPDYAGFVFFPPSSRFVTVEQAKELSRRLSRDIIPVGVFLDNTIEEIEAVSRSGAVQVLQIHGKNAPELVRYLKKTCQLPVWEAISVRTAEDVARAQESPADRILLDHGRGGTGETFDWSLLENMGREFFLAGGLNVDNITEALGCRPYGVDVSSGVETDGRKDPVKIRQLIRTVRDAI